VTATETELDPAVSVAADPGLAPTPASATPATVAGAAAETVTAARPETGAGPETGGVAGAVGGGVDPVAVDGALGPERELDGARATVDVRRAEPRGAGGIDAVVVTVGSPATAGSD
jgi:hypothetical protein